MKLVPGSEWASSVKRLSTMHGYNYRDYEVALAWMDSKKKLLAYTLVRIDKFVATIDWIWSRPGKGTPFLQEVEKRLFLQCNTIKLLVSIDKRERKPTILRRMNFYIKNEYRVADVRYDPTGVMLTMTKSSPD